MRIKEELDATEVMAIDSLKYHVVPRVIAMTIACPLLNIAGSIAGAGGGVLHRRLPQGRVWRHLPGGARAFGVDGCLRRHYQDHLFGLTIGLISCYHGFRATGGAAGVGKAVNDTVVHGIVAFITLNYFLTSALFGTVAP